MKKFEYKFLEMPTNGGVLGFVDDVDMNKLMEDLNTSGEEGWEAVCSVDENQMAAGGKKTVIILKREINQS